jgi:hypothetical protein
VYAVTNLNPIAEKLAKIARKLGDKNPNEKALAWKALVRTLDGFGADFNDFGDHIKHAGNGALNEAEMLEIYEAGIKEGERRAECKLRNQNHYGTPQLRFPSAQDMAMYCYQRIDDLNDWEAEFITNMVGWTRRRPLSVRQQSRLEEVYLKLGGRI